MSFFIMQLLPDDYNNRRNSLNVRLDDVTKQFLDRFLLLREIVAT